MEKNLYVNLVVKNSKKIKKLNENGRDDIYEIFKNFISDEHF